MPAEIENNYSPGLLHIYAFDNTGREASGATESFYVYGYDESAPIDVEGPEISRFVLNGDSFADGGVVNPSPVVLAAFSDPSGINVSEAGLGHRLSLCLDGKTYYDDLASYYLPAADDITAGSLTYPLTGLDAGAHTLELTVWDNANNSSSASLTFNVGRRPDALRRLHRCQPRQDERGLQHHHRPPHGDPRMPPRRHRP